LGFRGNRRKPHGTGGFGRKLQIQLKPKNMQKNTIFGQNLRFEKTRKMAPTAILERDLKKGRRGGLLSTPPKTAISCFFEKK
jgi:hypothetical protein